MLGEQISFVHLDPIVIPVKNNYLSLQNERHSVKLTKDSVPFSKKNKRLDQFLKQGMNKWKNLYHLATIYLNEFKVFYDEEFQNESDDSLMIV